MWRSDHCYNNSEPCELLVLPSCTDSDSDLPVILYTQQPELHIFGQVFTRSAYVTSNSDSSSSPEAWKPEGQRVGSPVGWSDSGHIARCHSRVRHGGGPLSSIGDWWQTKDVRKINPLHGRDAASGWDLKTPLKAWATSSEVPRCPTYLPPFPPTVLQHAR
jgi:hypothetical protein